MIRSPENGVSLLNVLVVVAVVSGLVQVMLSGQQDVASDLQQAKEAAQAGALARGGITSVAIALRRDLRAAPQVDHMQEDWAKAAQQKVTFEFGSYEVKIEDARGRFNLNALTSGAFLEQRLFVGLLAALDLPETIAGQLITSLQTHGLLDDPSELYERGFADADVRRLVPHISTLGISAPINLNSATPALLSALFANPVAAQALVARRAQKGFLARDDLSALGLILPASAGFTSDAYDIALVAEVGNARRVLKRRIMRDVERGSVEIITID